MLRIGLLVTLCVGVVFAGDAWATRLEFAPEAHFLAHLGAAILLYLHIGGGAIGLISGTVTVMAPKGGHLHRTAGKVFLVSMLVAYVVAAGVAPFLADGRRPNFVAAILSIYLLVSGIAAARRRRFQAGRGEIAGLLVALSVVGMGALFMVMGANSASGTVDGSPPQAFILFIVVGLLAAIGEVKALVQRALTPTARIIRHLWRMCVSFFIASASLFLGQPQVFSVSFNESPWPLILSIAPLLAGLFWGIKTLWRVPLPIRS